MLTEKESKVLRVVFSSFGEFYSVNQIARMCQIAPNGSLKILKKFEKEGILKKEIIGRLHSYTINFNTNKTMPIIQLALISHLEGRVSHRYEDLAKLKDIADIAILFGSYTNLSKNPNDLDILFVIKKSNFDSYKKASKTIFQTIPIKVHDVIQTKEDMIQNIADKDKVIINIIRTGVILWGQDKLIEIVKHGYPSHR
ncbi:MAG: hypothetical protein AABX11_01290 [Nanoarchaeota archaeon]